MIPTLTTFAGRPLTVDDAEPVATGQFEFEAGVGYVKQSDLDHVDFPLALTYGLLPRLETGLGFGGQLEEREEVFGRTHTVCGIGDLALGGKWKALDAERVWADQAVAFTVKFPTACCRHGLGSGRLDYDVTLIASKQLADKASAHVNVGHTWAGDHADENFDDILHYGVAADYQLTQSLQLVAEVFADTPITAESETTVAVNGGVRWSATEALTFDAAAGAGLRGDAPDVTATVGLTWAFGLNDNR